MKIRNGFVSNSSSSSFMLIGVIANDELVTKLKEKYGEDEFYDEPDGLVYLSETDDDELIGYLISTGGDEYLEDGNLSFDDFKKSAEKLAELIEVDVSKIKLYYGTHAC